MGELTLELDAKVKTNQCEKCGFEYPRVHGFVYEDGDALAVYWAAIYVGHPEHPTPRVDLTIALGEDWSEGTDASQRFYAQLDVWPTDEQVRMAFHDVDGAPLERKSFGSPLSRASALASPSKDVFFRVADHIAYDDPRVSKALGTKP
jgi:hypothetical protein